MLDQPSTQATPSILRHENILRDSHTIEGNISDFSIAIIDMLLSLQNDPGNILEIGVYRGKSAVVFAHHIKVGERLILVDIADYFDRPAISLVLPCAEFIVCASETLPDHPVYPDLANSCRVIHIDASHRFDPTLRELAIADHVLIENGIVILDDFVNLNYSANVAAIYKYIYTSGTTLTPFLVTDDKAYLCRQSAFGYYGDFILWRSWTELGIRGLVNIVLARTDRHKDYAAFYLRGAYKGETPGRYAESIYGGYYNSP